MTTTTDRAPRTLKPLDFLDVDALLSGEERMIRDTVRQFVRERVMPGIEEWFEIGIFPAEMAAEMGRLGREYVTTEADRSVAVGRYRTLLEELTA